MRASRRSIGTRLATVAPTFAFGVAAGVTGGIFAATTLDTTPYGETEFNTASRNAHQAGQSQGQQVARQAAEKTVSQLKEAHAEEVVSLQSRLAEVRHALAAQKRSQQKAEQQARERATRLQGDLAEATAALDNATGTDTGSGQQVSGTLRTTWVLGPGAKPWPTGCAEPLQTYRVRVTAGAGATVAVADLVGAETTRRTEKKGERKNEKPELTLVCSLTYSASLPTPLGSGYRFVVENASTDTAVDQSARITDGSLADGSGPALSVSR